MALAHQVCPYYLAQEMARWSDVVVGDYNYYFDSSALLHSLANANQWRVAVLVDEAHNLVERARRMYSAELDQLSLMALRKAVPTVLKKPLERVNRAWGELNKQQVDLPLAAMVALALVLLVKSEGLQHTGWSAALGIVLGLGMLTKPPFAVYVAPPVVWAVLAARDRRALRNTGLALALGAVVSLPWYGPRLFGMGHQAVARSFEQAAEAGAPDVLTWAGLTFYPAWRDFPSEDEVGDTRRVNEFIEQRALEMPEQYLWVHRRFKTRPPGEAGFY